MISLIDQYNLLCEAYYGIELIDEYSLKVYELKKVEELINNFKKNYKIDNFDYEKHFNYVKDNVSNKTKMQSSLIILNRSNGPLELILLIKKRLKEEE